MEFTLLELFLIAVALWVSRILGQLITHKAQHKQIENQ
jgi:uncharacterized protein YneF (UPF0154 family)